MSSKVVAGDRGEKSDRRARARGLLSAPDETSNRSAGLGGWSRGQRGDRVAAFLPMVAGEVIEWYEGGAGEAVLLQCIGWSLATTPQVEQLRL